MAKKILHLVSQLNQPIGSSRKCCERCGLAVNRFPDSHAFCEWPEEYTMVNAKKHGYKRCIDRN